MAPTKTNAKGDIHKKFKRVLETPAGFDFYVAIHDFIQHIELSPALASNLSTRIKLNQELKIPEKYAFLKQIYQGLEDTGSASNDDLGHTRYMVIKDLNKIRNKDVSESNPIWKKRELLRKISQEVYERIS